jgi:hypothetical protein
MEILAGKTRAVRPIEMTDKTGATRTRGLRRDRAEKPE